MSVFICFIHHSNNLKECFTVRIETFRRNHALKQIPNTWRTQKKIFKEKVQLIEIKPPNFQELVTSIDFDVSLFCSYSKKVLSKCKTKIFRGLFQLIFFQLKLRFLPNAVYYALIYFLITRLLLFPSLRNQLTWFLGLILKVVILIQQWLLDYSLLRKCP